MAREQVAVLDCMPAIELVRSSIDRDWGQWFNSTAGKCVACMFIPSWKQC